MDISDLQWWGWLLLLAPVVLIAAGLPVWFLWLGRRPRMPKGKVYKDAHGGCRVRCVFQTEKELVSEDGVGMVSSRKRMARRCARAVWSAARAWERDGRSGGGLMGDVVVLIQSDEAFEASPFPSIQNAAAYAAYTGAPVGNGLPMAVVRGDVKTLTGLLKRGEPVIHECIHLLLGETSEPDKDRNHDAPGAWGKAGVQGAARKLFGILPSFDPTA